MTERPFCETCGKDVAEVLCPTCAKWWADNPPDLVTVHRAELEAIRSELAQVVWDALKGDHNDLRKQQIIIRWFDAKLEVHLKGQP